MLVKTPKLAVRPYRHHPKYKFVLDLRPWGRGRQFYKTRAEADAELRRQKTTLERHGREAVGLPQHELSDFIRARKTLADYGKTINDAVGFFVDHLERGVKLIPGAKSMVTPDRDKDGGSKAAAMMLDFLDQG